MLPNHTGLYYSASLRGVGSTIINIFIPIYLYRELGSFSLVFWFYAAHHLAAILSSYPAGYLINRLGVDISGLIGGLLHSLFFLFLIIGRIYPQFFILAMLVWGISIPFTWLPHHFYITSGHSPRLGQRVAFLLFINRWLSAISPLIGGILLNFGGFNLVYFLAIIVLGVSGIPLLLDDYNYQPQLLSLDTVWQELKNSNRRLMLALFSSGIESYLMSSAWPLYLYLIVKSYVKVGLVQTGSLVISTIFIYWIGKSLDKKNKAGYFRPALALNSLNLFCRGLISATFPLFILETIYQLGSIFVWLPFDAKIYTAAREEKRLEFFIRREWLIHSGGLISSIILVAFFTFGAHWSLVFGLGAVSLFLMGLIKI